MLKIFALFFISCLLLANGEAFAFSFAVFGDNRDGDSIYKKILKSVSNDKDISFAINTGDFISNGKLENYQRYITLIRPIKFKIYHVLGNHDGVYGGYKHFEKYFGSTYYSFNYENSHFIILDNAFSKSFDSDQYDWLIKDLKTNKNPNIFVFMHKPAFDATEFYEDHVMDSRRMSEVLINTFKEYKVDYVFAGHIHGYGRALRDDVVYIITGGGGAPLYLPYYAGGFFNYIKVTVDGAKIKDEVVKIDE